MSIRRASTPSDSCKNTTRRNVLEENPAAQTERRARAVAAGGYKQAGLTSGYRKSPRRFSSPKQQQEASPQPLRLAAQAIGGDAESHRPCCSAVRTWLIPVDSEAGASCLGFLVAPARRPIADRRQRIRRRIVRIRQRRRIPRRCCRGVRLRSRSDDRGYQG